MNPVIKKNSGFLPKMIQDVFDTNPFDWGKDFWMQERGLEVPSTNVIENDKEFKLELSAPGFDKNDFKVDLKDGILSISAEKEQKSEEKKENYRKKEFSYSSIRRSFSLPNYIIEDKIDAKYENGILRIIIPKSDEIEKDSKKAIKVS